MSYSIKKSELSDWMKSHKETCEIASVKKKIAEARPTDFVLTLQRGEEECGFTFCRIASDITLYWRYIDETSLCPAHMEAMLDFSLQNYQLVRINILNSQTKLLDLVLRARFLIHGTYVDNGEVHVELEFSKY